MYSRVLYRFFHRGSSSWNLNKSDLAVLRKKTGYTISNCKKALELNSNNITLAEKWLKEQAQALGWERATKLEGRQTTQGLIGVAKCNSAAVLVEVNCETDFVARNKQFLSLVELCTVTCLNEALKLDLPTSGHLVKVHLESDEVKNCVGPKEKLLVDFTALAMSSLNENLNLRRALLLKVSEGIHLAIYVHPYVEDTLYSKVLSGKFGSVVAYTSLYNFAEEQLIAKDLCQHVVGMNPSKVGIIGVDVPDENKDNEKVMLHQEFLLDSEITVSQYIENTGLNIVDFFRFECGEQLLLNKEKAVLTEAG